MIIKISPTSPKTFEDVGPIVASKLYACYMNNNSDRQDEAKRRATKYRLRKLKQWLEDQVFQGPFSGMIKSKPEFASEAIKSNCEEVLTISSNNALTAQINSALPLHGCNDVLLTMLLAILIYYLLHNIRR